MFGIEERERLKDVLISAAQLDEQISAAALTGSAASGTQDRWSDIDLALGLVREADLALVLADWTEAMYRDHGAVHHTDLRRGGTIYRVFLLANTLQVDIAFSPAEEFGATGPSFRLIFGTAQEQKQAREPAAVDLVGMGWLYALHARSSIARGKVWQAEYMISGLRDHVLALACLRRGAGPVT
jgi:predicted nucleotidyltransferase